MLGARYNGGRVLSPDGVNEAERDAQGFFLSPFHGSLRKVGAPTVAQGAASGFSSDDYFEGVLCDFDAPCTIAIKLTMPATPVANQVFISRAAGSGAGLELSYTTTEDFQAYAYDAGGTARLAKLLSLAPTTEGSTVWLFLALEAADPTGVGTVAWDEDGGDEVQDTTGVYGTAPVVGGITHVVGKDAAGSAPFAGTIHEIRGFASVLSVVQMEAVTSDESPPTAQVVHDFPDQQRLAVDAGFGEGAVVGYQRLHDLLTAGVIRQPASARLSGFDQLSNDDHGLVAFSTSQLGVLALANRATAYDCLFDSVNNANRAQFGMGAGTNARARTTDSGVTELADTAGGMATGPNYIGGRIDGSTGDMASRWWDVDGVVGATAIHTGTAPVDVTGAAYLGRNNSPGYAWTNGVTWVLAWDGTAPELTTFDAIVADHQAGATVAELKATYGASVGCLGVVTGTYAEAAPTALYESIGTGPPVTVASDNTGALNQPAAGLSQGQYLQTDGDVLAMPEEGSLILAIDLSAIDSGDKHHLVTVGGLACRIDATGSPHEVEVRIDVGTAYASSVVTTALDADITQIGLFFVIVKYENTSGTTVVRRVAIFDVGAAGSANNTNGGGVSGPLVTGPVVVGATEGAAAAAFTGRVSWAFLAEHVNDSVIAPQLTDFYAPKLVGLNRGTMVAYGEYNTADGGEISADDVVSGGMIMTGLGWELQGSGDAPAGHSGVLRGYDRSELTEDDGEHMEAAAWDVGPSGTMLFFGDISAIGTNTGWLCGSLGPTASDGGVVMFLPTTTQVRALYRRTGSGATQTCDYTISDVTAAGAQLYFTAWDGAFPGFRTGIGDMVADAAYGTRATEQQEASTDYGASFASRVSGYGETDRSVTGTGMWALCLSRQLTAAEWAMAARGIWAWAKGDPDLLWIFAPDDEALPGDDVVADTNRNDAGGPYVVVHDGGGTAVPMTVS